MPRTTIEGFIELKGKTLKNRALAAFCRSQLYRRNYAGEMDFPTEEEKEQAYFQFMEEGTTQENLDLITKVRFKPKNVDEGYTYSLYEITIPCEAPILKGTRHCKMHPVNVVLTFSETSTFLTSNFDWETDLQWKASLHPHISVNGEPCLGGFERPYYHTLNQSPLTHFKAIAESFLNNWTRNDAYWDINNVNTSWNRYKATVAQLLADLGPVYPEKRIKEIKKLNTLTYAEYLMHETQLTTVLNAIDNARGIMYDMMYMDGGAFTKYKAKLLSIENYNQSYTSFILEIRDFYVWYSKNMKEQSLHNQIQKVAIEFKSIGFPHCIQDESRLRASFMHCINGPDSYIRTSLNKSLFRTYTGIELAEGGNLNLASVRTYALMNYGREEFSRQIMVWETCTAENLKKFKNNDILESESLAKPLDKWRYMINTTINPRDYNDTTCIPAEDETYSVRISPTPDTFLDETRDGCHLDSSARLGIIGDSDVDEFFKNNLERKYMIMTLTSMGLHVIAFPIAAKFKYLNQLGFKHLLNDSLILVPMRLEKDRSFTDKKEQNYGVIIKKEVIIEMYDFLLSFSEMTSESRKEIVTYISAILKNLMNIRILENLNKLTRRHNEQSIKNNRIINDHIDIENKEGNEGQSSLFVE